MSDPSISITETFHKHNILVHPYVAKDDFLRFSDDPLDEYEYYFKTLSLDGIFSENPKTAILARDYLSHAKKDQ